MVIGMKKRLDMLEDLLCRQYDLQEYLGNWERIDCNPSMKQKFINQMILALHEETVELMRESAYKNPAYVEFGWKKGQEGNIEKFKDEIIDVLHFIFTLALIVDMNAEEIHKRYVIKNDENVARQKRNY